MSRWAVVLLVLLFGFAAWAEDAAPREFKTPVVIRIEGPITHWLEHLVLRDRMTGSEETVEADGLFIMIGARPHTEWLPPEI